MLFGVFFAFWRFMEIITLVRSAQIPLLSVAKSSFPAPSKKLKSYHANTTVYRSQQWACSPTSCTSTTARTPSPPTISLSSSSSPSSPSPGPLQPSSPTTAPPTTRASSASSTSSSSGPSSAPSTPSATSPTRTAQTLPPATRTRFHSAISVLRLCEGSISALISSVR